MLLQCMLPGQGGMLSYPVNILLLFSHCCCFWTCQEDRGLLKMLISLSDETILVCLGVKSGIKHYSGYSGYLSPIVNI